MDNLNLSQRDYFMLSCLLFVGLVVYMEIRKIKCHCGEGMVNTEMVQPTFKRSLVSLGDVDHADVGTRMVQPTWYRSVTSLPSVDGNLEETARVVPPDFEQETAPFGNIKCRGGACKPTQ